MNPSARFAASLLAALALAACAPRAATPTAAPAAAPGMASETLVPQAVADDPPLTLYPVLDGAPLLAAPASDAPRLELLPAARAVVRFRLRGGWARVLDPASGHIGWMDNRLLTPRAPAAEQPPGKGAISETF